MKSCYLLTARVDLKGSTVFFAKNILYILVNIKRDNSYYMYLKKKNLRPTDWPVFFPTPWTGNDNSTKDGLSYRVIRLELCQLFSPISL